MKLKKVFGALAVLLALTVVGCNNAPANSASSKKGGAVSSSSALPSIKVTAAGNKTTLEIDETVQLSADIEGITWESSATGVATVSDQGLVTAVGAGTAKISAKKDGYKEGSISITVKKPVDPLWTPLPRTWADGTPAQNSANKEYIKKWIGVYAFSNE